MNSFISYKPPYALFGFLNIELPEVLNQGNPDIETDFPYAIERQDHG